MDRMERAIMRHALYRGGEELERIEERYGDKALLDLAAFDADVWAGEEEDDTNRD